MKDLNSAMDAELKEGLAAKDARQARRALAILALNLGMSPDTVSSVFNKSGNWTQNLVTKFNKNGATALSAKTSPGRPRKYGDDVRQAVSDIRAKNTEGSLTDIMEEANKTLGTAMSLPTVRTMVLNNFVFSQKRVWGQKE
jgi:transposase